MPSTRTITVYEFIPIDELGAALDEDERCIADSINSFVKIIRDKQQQGIGCYSWDETLVGSFDEGEFEALQKHVMEEFKRRRNVPDYLWNFRGLGFGFGLESSIPQSAGSSVQDFVKEKFFALIADPILKPASYEALQYWVLCGKQNMTITVMEEALRHYSNALQKSVEKADVYELLVTSLRTALERSVTEKAETTKKLQYWAIRDVLRKHGNDWKTFEPGVESLTVEQIYQSCKSMKPNLFRMGKDTFRTSTWQSFRTWRDAKLATNISISSLLLRATPDTIQGV